MEKKEFNWGRAGKIFLGIVIAAVVVLAVRRIFFIKEEVDKTPLSTVSVGTPEIGTVEVETALVGTMLPGDVYYVVPKLAGEVKKVYVKTGDTVKKGDPICEIDNSKQVDGAKLQLDQAKAQLDLYSANLERMEALYKSGDVSLQTYEQTKAGADSAQSAYESAKLQYDTYVEYSVVTAPVSGNVDSTSMTIDGLVSQQSPVAVISVGGDGQLQFNVTDRLISSIEVGDAVRVEKQGVIYDGEITSKDTIPGQTTGLYLVKANIKGAKQVPAGSSVKVFFVSERSEDTVLVPTDTIYYDGGHTYVYTVSYDEGSSTIVADGNRAATVHKTEVITGITDSKKTEILSGIDENTEIIITWTSQLFEGASVQVLGGVN
ncbi:MAG: efflux RND transporter periplasmic adaptor subunit [Eubacteriales bacterium]|nr:efflux RND transporter periplasmic adaptor subunit [Eubacteriales bacterium]